MCSRLMRHPLVRLPSAWQGGMRARASSLSADALYLKVTASMQVRPVVADFLGYFRASGTQGGITSGSQWLVRRQRY